MRAECDTQPWMQVCAIPLYWEAVACDIYTPKADPPPPPEIDDPYAGFFGVLPWYIVHPFMVLSTLW